MISMAGRNRSGVMRLRFKKTSKQDETRKKRNELADLILNIREQTASSEIKERLFGLEKQLMEFKVNISGTGTYGAELKQLLLDFPSVHKKGISQITDSYLNRMRDRITRWQQQDGMEEDPHMPLKLFGRKKAKENSPAAQREKCERDIFILDQKNTELAFQMERFEKEKQDLMLQAAKYAPGSQGYLLIKQKYNRIENESSAVAAQKALVQKALNSNYDYLNIIDTGKNLKEIKGFMPPIPEKIEMEVQDNIAVKSNIVDELDKAQDIMRYGNTQLQDINKDAAGSSLSDPFDAAVNQIREADQGYRAILGPEVSLVDEMRKPSDKNAQVVEAADSIKEEKL